MTPSKVNNSTIMSGNDFEVVEIPKKSKEWL
jgi:hypothetical protein